MSAYVLSVDAALDLEDIWEYIAADSVDAADRWVGELFNAFEALASTPGMGHKTRGSDGLSGPVLAGRFLPRHLSSRALID